MPRAPHAVLYDVNTVPYSIRTVPRARAVLCDLWAATVQLPGPSFRFFASRLTVTVVTVKVLCTVYAVAVFHLYTLIGGSSVV